jgi:hypothetical protein
MPVEPRLKRGDCNARVGLEIALKSYKTLPFNERLEAAVHARFKPMPGEMLELRKALETALFAVSGCAESEKMDCSLYEIITFSVRKKRKCAITSYMRGGGRRS